MNSDQKQFSIRIVFLHLILIISFAIILKQLFNLQITEGNYYKEMSFKNRIRSVWIPAPRGKIFDRNEIILVDNRPRFDIVATIEDIVNPEKEAEKISKLLNIPYTSVLKSLTDKTSHLPYEPSTIETDLSIEQITKISEVAYSIAGIDLKILPVRSYIHDKMACHVFGYTGKISSAQSDEFKEKGYNINENIGKSGIEASYEHYLRGTSGGRQIQINSLGHLDKIFGEKKPVIGNDIFLSLDYNIQKTLTDAYSEKHGAAVVIDVRNGDILGMISSPGFDPNTFSTGNNKIINQYFIDATFPLLNRAISSQYAPGSIFKPIVALAGLSTGYINKNTSIFCNGIFKIKGTEFKCWRKWGHGETDLLTSIEQSCNLFYYNVGKEIGWEPIYKIAAKFGLGETTGINLLGEKTGTLPSAEWKKTFFSNKQDQKWHLGDTINFSIGQGYLLVTPIQMACMAAAIANGGSRPIPNLLKKVKNPISETIFVNTQPEFINLNIPKEHIDIIREGMKNVVNAKHGTGRKSKINNITIAGKTGTAQLKVKNKDIKNTWFISFAPYDEPEIALCILVENAESGGLDAAPIAKSVYSTYFKILDSQAEINQEKVITTNIEDEAEIEETLTAIMSEEDEEEEVVLVENDNKKENKKEEEN